MSKTILIVDDDKKIAGLLEFHLQKRGYETVCAYNGQEALERAAQISPALVLLDIRLPDIQGTEVLKTLHEKHPGTHVIMISAHADVKVAVESMKSGAYDFVEKPIAWPELDAKVDHVFERFRLEEEIQTLRKQLGNRSDGKALIGKSPAMKRVFELIDIAANGDVDTLILGESGTGKELVARAIHSRSPRKDRPFIAVNCGAIPEPLLETELFGHEKGSFTGAIARKIGKFEQAEGGTIFLDEMGDLPKALQVKLLRVLQEREIERVGGTKPIPINVRFISATHGDLNQLVSDGKFREDLFFRINIFPIRIPSLRERKEDIPALWLHFASQREGEPLRMEPSALEHLVNYSWPGNVRELANAVERLLLLKGQDSVVTEKDILALNLSAPFAKNKSAAASDLLPQRPSKIDRALLDQTLQKCSGNVSQACRRLGISRDTYYRKMKQLSPA